MILKRFIYLLLKLIQHLLLLYALGFAFFLYSDNYDIFPWATHDEALKFLHLIISVPIPLLVSIAVNALIKRKKGGIHYYVLRFFPIICLVLVSGYFFLITSLDPLLLKIGFGITILLAAIEIYLIIYDLIMGTDGIVVAG